MFDSHQALHSASPVTPLPPIPEETPGTFPDPQIPDEPPNPDEEPPAPDENPFPRVVPQPIATPEE